MSTTTDIITDEDYRFYRQIQLFAIKKKIARVPEFWVRRRDGVHDLTEENPGIWWEYTNAKEIGDISELDIVERKGCPRYYIVALVVEDRKEFPVVLG